MRYRLLSSLVCVLLRVTLPRPFKRSARFDVLKPLCNGCLRSVEMCLRIFALGLWRGRHAYLQNNYNRLDCAVVLASWALKIAGWEHISQPIYPGSILTTRSSAVHALSVRVFSSTPNHIY